jgi:hypothetical protein
MRSTSSYDRKPRASSHFCALSLSLPSHRRSAQLNDKHRRACDALTVFEPDVGQTHGISEKKGIALSRIIQLGQHFDHFGRDPSADGIIKFFMSAESRKQYPDDE